MSGLICAGNVYLDRIVSNARTGEHGPINATKFSVNPGSAEKIDRISYRRDDFGQALDSVVFPGVSTLSIETDDAAADILQYALLGTLSDVTAASGSVVTGTPEVIVARLGFWTKLAHRNVNVTAVRAVADTPVYTLGTHYVVDATAGMIKFLAASGSPADGDNVEVVYTYGALNSKQILAATTTEVRAFVRLEGTNLANQKGVSIVCPLAVLTPSGELDIAGKAFIKFGLSGTLVTDTANGYTSPFIYNEYS